MKVLIVKTSALGDIIQAFGVLNYLHDRFPGIEVDWVVESSLQSIVAAHPLVRTAIAVNTKSMRKKWSWSSFSQTVKLLRKERYDVLFDLQKNMKSGLISAFSRSAVKVGFGFKTVREWPNVLATNKRFNLPIDANIRLQYLGLLQKYFGDDKTSSQSSVQFRIQQEEKTKVASILQVSSHTKIMVCPGSKWINKQLPVETMTAFLLQIQSHYGADFYLMWGDAEEKAYCEQIQKKTGGVVVDRLSIPAWQNLMCCMDLVIAVDSSALHLSATTGTRSFSLFGPTSPDVFKPIGEAHFAMQGSCPYGKTFIKACPVLRTCSTGACIRHLSAEKIFKEFSPWWESTIVARSY